MSVHVLGIGSPAGDDQAGWLVVDALAARALDDVVLEKLDRPGASLVGRIEHAAHVVIVDATQSGRTPGAVVHVSGDAWAGYRGGLSSHGFGVLDALALAQAIDALPPRIEVYGIEIEAAEPLAAPSVRVREAAARLAAEIAARLEARARGPRAAA